MCQVPAPSSAPSHLPSAIDLIEEGELRITDWEPYSTYIQANWSFQRLWSKDLQRNKELLVANQTIK